MTTVTVETATPALPSPGPWGLLRTTLRLHRWALGCWLLLVAVGAGVLLWAHGPGMDAAWAEYRATGCGRPNAGELGCGSTRPAYGRYDTAVTLGTVLLVLIPLLTGVWAGGALIGRELESGTAQVAWTQSVSPVRWLTAKLAVPAALLVPGTLTLTLLHRQLWSPGGQSRFGLDARLWYESDTFVANGTLATAYALLGLAVGALAGLLLRRALPALGAAALVLTGVMYTRADLRPYLWPAMTTTSTNGPPEFDSTLMAFESGALTSTGDRITSWDCLPDTSCARENGVVAYYRDFHPPSHFWPLQLVETGIVLALAALAVLAAFRLLRRRTP